MKSLKIFGFTCAAVAALAFAPQEASAHSFDSDDSAHPFRLLSYPFHALGRGVEYGVARPVHHCVSQPRKRWLYGHVSHPRSDNYWGDYDQYQRQSY